MRTRFFALSLMILICLAFAGTAKAVPATVLTNQGEAVSGVLDGLSPVLRLNRPVDQPFVGPDSQFDVPLEMIRQITFDFPRVIVETVAGTLIGPYSAFTGIGELLSLDTGAGTISLAATALRAIALNGNSLRQVPREWMPNEFLVDPDVFRTRVLALTSCDDCSTTAPEEPVVQPVADDEAERSETEGPEVETTNDAADAGSIPWWVLLLVAGVVAYLLLA